MSRASAIFGSDKQSLGVVYGGPWQRAKIPPYWPLCGAIVLDYGTPTPHICRNCA